MIESVPVFFFVAVCFMNGDGGIAKSQVNARGVLKRT